MFSPAVCRAVAGLTLVLAAAPASRDAAYAQTPTITATETAQTLGEPSLGKQATKPLTEIIEQGQRDEPTPEAMSCFVGTVAVCP
jgi:hypothetical protein